MYIERKHSPLISFFVFSTPTWVHFISEVVDLRKIEDKCNERDLGKIVYLINAAIDALERVHTVRHTSDKIYIFEHGIFYPSLI